MVPSTSNGNPAAIPANALNTPRNVLPAVTAKVAIPDALPHQSLLLEGEDARLTGMTRSLHRRLFGLNLPEKTSTQSDLPAAA